MWAFCGRLWASVGVYGRLWASVGVYGRVLGSAQAEGLVKFHVPTIVNNMYVLLHCDTQNLVMSPCFIQTLNIVNL